MIFLNISFGNFFNAHQIIEIGGLLLLLAIVYIETCFFLGFVLPGGDNMLLTACVFCGTQYLDIFLFWLVVLLIAASFLGDFTGYFKGKWLAGKIFTDNKSPFFKKEHLEHRNGFYNRYGNWAFNMGRFMPVIRTLMPMIAKYWSYRLRKILIFNLADLKVWISTLVPRGYFIDRSYRQIIYHLAWVLVGISLIVSIPILQILV